MFARVKVIMFWIICAAMMVRSLQGQSTSGSILSLRLLSTCRGPLAQMLPALH